jgi:Na+-translocating ferredoxin:NAD+ oxidoreductase RnfG subunit
MSKWVRWSAPVVAAMTITQPVQAVQYLTIGAAQKLAFPSATHIVEAHVVYRPADIEAIQKISGQPVRTRGEQVWKAFSGDRLAGFFVLDYVIGKHLVIDYSVSLEADGRVRRVDILEYRESYGGEVRSESWLAQFVGKRSGSTLEVNKDIRNISGATLSSRHVTEGVKRILALYEVRLK